MENYSKAVAHFKNLFINYPEDEVYYRRTSERSSQIRRWRDNSLVRPAPGTVRNFYLNNTVFIDYGRPEDRRGVACIWMIRSFAGQDYLIACNYEILFPRKITAAPLLTRLRVFSAATKTYRETSLLYGEKWDDYVGKITKYTFYDHAEERRTSAKNLEIIREFFGIKKYDFIRGNQYICMKKPEHVAIAVINKQKPRQRKSRDLRFVERFEPLPAIATTQSPDHPETPDHLEVSDYKEGYVRFERLQALVPVVVIRYYRVCNGAIIEGYRIYATPYRLVTCLVRDGNLYPSKQRFSTKFFGAYIDHFDASILAGTCLKYISPFLERILGRDNIGAAAGRWLLYAAYERWLEAFYRSGLFDEDFLNGRYITRYGSPEAEIYSYFHINSKVLKKPGSLYAAVGMSHFQIKYYVDNRQRLLALQEDLCGRDIAGHEYPSLFWIMKRCCLRHASFDENNFRHRMVSISNFDQHESVSLFSKYELFLRIFRECLLGNIELVLHRYNFTHRFLEELNKAREEEGRVQQLFKLIEDEGEDELLFLLDRLRHEIFAFFKTVFFGIYINPWLLLDVRDRELTENWCTAVAGWSYFEALPDEIHRAEIRSLHRLIDYLIYASEAFRVNETYRRVRYEDILELSEQLFGARHQPEHIDELGLNFLGNLDQTLEMSVFREKLASALCAAEKHNYDGQDYIIRAPWSYEDLSREGYILSHCVATYAGKIAAGESLIFFLRRKTDPDRPFYTIEIQDGLIAQIRGRSNESLKRGNKAYAFVEQWLSREFAK
ncbi:MAG: hypothetical protein GX907_03965 [Clostridiaceae bacterium]|nr:hypothetical protein [Clostridiaceae bacterium]